MGTDGACGLLFCAAKRSGTFPPNTPAGLRARVSRLGGFTRVTENLRSIESFYGMLERGAQKKTA